MLVRPDVERPDRPNPAQMLLMHLAWSVIRAMEGHTYMHNTICDSSVYLRSCLPSNLCINLPMISLLCSLPPSLLPPPSCMPACMYTYHTYYIYTSMYVYVYIDTYALYTCASSPPASIWRQVLPNVAEAIAHLRRLGKSAGARDNVRRAT